MGNRNNRVRGLETVCRLGLSVVSGGGLDTPNIAESDAQSAETWFTPSSDGIRYTNSDGNPSALSLSADAIRSSVVRAADASGASVSSITFGAVLGTDVVVNLSVANPVAWANALNATSMIGSIDERDLEGIMFVVRDTAGNLIKCATFSTGYEEGAAFYGAQYERPPFALNAAPPTQAPSSAG